ncbi:MAG: hypothetical protein B6I18_06830 [Bacteroidetes bacterium 4572_112]|nr:MAG: hypothetical protein B6I18_06830 [Bacteroidetes bacterium 4572_112]
MRTLKYVSIALLTFILVACGSDTKKFVKSPIDTLIKDMSNLNSFVIILYDMDYFEDEDAYKHQYQILKDGVDTVTSEITPWYVVSDVLFKQHQDDMGMEVASKKDGVVTKAVSPAGYSNYVGNEKYGHWQQRSNGGSFWAFYGQYMFMSSMFRMSMYPVSRGYYSNYRSNYYGRQPYYGHNGARTYGTNSSYNKSRTNSRWNKRPSSFKSKVRSRVSQSTSRKSRTSSRYSQSRSRSRGGGSGK